MKNIKSDNFISEYEKIKFKNEVKKEKFIDELLEKNPELKAKQKQMNSMLFHNLKLVLNKEEGEKETLKEIKAVLKDIKEIEIEKKELLKQYGINPKDLEVKYNCNKCKDTGFIKVKEKSVKCTCYIQKEIEAKYQNSNLNSENKKTFENFKLNYYDTDKINEDSKVTSKEQAEKVFSICKEYAENFEQICKKEKNGIIITGNTGLRKNTFIRGNRKLCNQSKQYSTFCKCYKST